MIRKLFFRESPTFRNDLLPSSSFGKKRRQEISSKRLCCRKKPHGAVTHNAIVFIFTVIQQEVLIRCADEKCLDPAGKWRKTA
jgi:hypothetical protein